MSRVQITRALLTKLYACADEIEWFDEDYPDGVCEYDPTSIEDAARLAPSPYWSWWVDHGGEPFRLTGGDDSILTGGYRSVLTGGVGSVITGGVCSTLTGGDDSTLTGSPGSVLTGSAGSVLISRYWGDGRLRRAVAHVGEDGIEPDTPYTYRDGRWVEVER